MIKTLIDIFTLFEKNGNREAFIFRTGVRRIVFKYKEIYSLSLKMKAFLSSRGIKKGDRVGLWAPNSPFWAVCYFGIILNESIVVPIDFGSGKKRAQNILKLSGAKFVIQSNFKFEKIKSKSSVMIEDLPILLDKLKRAKKVSVSKKDIVEIVYTSGTTGDPKGVVLTHENIATNIKQAISHISIPKSIRSQINFLSVLPLSHMMEQTVGFLAPLYRGDRIVYLRAIKPSNILNALKDENIMVIIAVPRLLDLLKGLIEKKISKAYLSWLFKIEKGRKIIAKIVRKKIGLSFLMFVSGGAPLSLETFNFWKSIGFKTVEGYGLTECSPIISANTFTQQIPGSIGKEVAGVRTKIVNNELLVKGKNVFAKYYKNEKATKDAFVNGWFATGDYVEKNDKRLVIKGRKKDVIVKSSGINVYPHEIEEVLNKIEEVKDSCVLGIDKGKGEETHAVVLLKQKGLNVSNIIQKANGELDNLNQIESFSVWQDFDFPRTTTLKIRKFVVRQTVLSQGTKAQNKSTDTLLSILSRASRRSIKEIKETSILTTDLGMDSLSRLELINLLEQEFRIDLEDTSINQKTKVLDLRRLLEKREGIKKQKGLWFWATSVFWISLRKSLDRIVHYPLFRIFIRLKVNGTDNLKNIKSPVIFISNHISYLDQPVIMFSIPKILRYSTATAIREEFFFEKKGLFGFIVRKIAMPYILIGSSGFLLPQKSGFRESISFMGKLIDKNMNILIFPEGTRTRDGSIGGFMGGLGLLVKELEIPVVPVRIFGLDKIFPRGKIFPKKGTCEVAIGKPIRFTSESPSEIIKKSKEELLKLRP